MDEVPKRTEQYVWRPILVKIVNYNKIAPQVSFFFSHCCTFYEVVYFHLWFKTFFKVVAYYYLAAWIILITVSVVKFFVGSMNEFFHSYCKLFLTGAANYFLLLVMRFFFSLALRMISHGIVNLFFARYNLLCIFYLENKKVFLKVVNLQINFQV